MVTDHRTVGIWQQAAGRNHWSERRTGLSPQTPWRNKTEYCTTVLFLSLFACVARIYRNKPIYLPICHTHTPLSLQRVVSTYCSSGRPGAATLDVHV